MQYSELNNQNYPGRAFAVQQTYSGSTIVRIFDDSPKITRPQMPTSFVPGNSSWMSTSYDQFPSTGGRKDFRFFSVRASRVGSPIAITIAPPPPEPQQNTDGLKTAFIASNALSTTTHYSPAPLPLAYTNEGYAPYPPTSPHTPLEIYAPRSFQSDDDRYVRKKKSNRSDNSDSSSNTSSSSSDDVDGDRKIFHYLEFAIVSTIVNPIFGAVAIVLSLSSMYKAKRREYDIKEARWEARFSAMTAGLGIGITVLVVVMVLLYVRTNVLCSGDCPDVEMVIRLVARNRRPV